MSAPDARELQHILVPLDGSRLAESALPPALWLASTLGARLTLLHVLEHTPPEQVHGERHLSDLADAERYLAALASSQRANGSPIDYHVHPNPAHDVARSIAEHAAELAADLIVVSTHGSGGLRGFLFGSIAQQVLRQTAVPVFLVRPTTDAEARYVCREILVTLDGEPDAELALPLAQRIARPAGARLLLLRVVPTLATVQGERAMPASLLPSATAALLDMQASEAGTYLRAVASQIDGVPTATMVRRGNVADEIERAVGEVGADLVVVSTHGRSGLEGFITGSVAAQVIGRVGSPVLLLHSDAEVPGKR